MKGPMSRGITPLLVFLILIAVFGRPLPAFATAPVVTINLPSDGTSEDYGNSIDFTGSASDPADGDAIESYRWTSSIDGELSTSASFTTTTLSVGTHTIRLFATDENDEQGFDAITVTINDITPDVSITAPSDGAEYDYGDPLQTAGGVNVAFECTASDIQDDSGGADDGDIELSWSSSIDGVFGSLNDDGSPSLSPVTLSSGSHTITVTATDSDGYTATDSIGITVNNTPPDTVSITNPPDGSSFDYGDLVTFQGSATDPEDGTLTGASLVWTSSQGDPMGTGETFATDTLTSGTHVITLTASDSKGMSATDTITIEVGNAPPEAEIISPENRSEYAYREYITFEGTGTDPEDGSLAGSSLVWTSSSSTDPLGQGEVISVNDLPSGTHTITLTVTDSEGAEDTDSITVMVNNASPVATITSPSNNSSHFVGSTVSFTGTGTDVEDGELSGDALSWSSDVNGFIGTGATVETSDLSEGTHVITLTVTDSEGATGTDSITIEVGNEAPVATITSPSDNSYHNLGSSISFTGTGTDAEDGELSGDALSWSSDVNGFIGTGATVETSDLSEGTHVITLTVTDSEGATGTDSITIEVGNEAPVATITSPSDNSSHDLGSSISFTGTGTDSEDGELSGDALSWSSDVNGFIGTGATVETSDLSEGTHVITLTVTDSDGATNTDSITIEVGNDSPVATITSPVDNSSHNYGTTISFEGTGTDAEDGELSGDALSWSSDKDGFIGAGAAVTTSELSVGTHVITLTATDSQDVSAADTITISIKDDSPTSVTIHEPDDGEVFYYNEYIEFIGSASDNEDGRLTGSSLVWTSNQVSGTIGTGESFSINTLPIGEHLITLTATDSNGASISTFNVIEVKNTLPVAQITVPSDGASFEEGDVITFSGSAADEEDGNLTGSSLVWTSDIDGIIGVGVDVSNEKLSSGDHTITLTAIDSHGGQVSTSVSITVAAAEGGESLSTDTSEITVALDQNASVTVSGGHGPYRVSCNYPQIVDVALSGNTVTIMPLEAGETSIEISDHYEDTVVVDIEVTDASGNYPTANAGEDRNVQEGETVTLDGSSSLDGSYGIASWKWTQTVGEKAIVLSEEAAQEATFVAPDAEAASSLTFQLTVTDSNGSTDSDTVTITISDNGITGFPEGVTTFKTADGSKSLGVSIVGDGDFVLLKGKHKEFISDDTSRPNDMIYDLLEFQIKVKNAGDDVNLIVYFPESLGEDHACYKYSSTDGWYPYDDSYIRFDADRQKAYMILVDGGTGDDDGESDAMVTDPLTFGTAPSDDSETPDSGGGGGGGCFIDSLFE